jgi:hypothetical protein
MSGSTYNERETSANHEGDRLLEDEPPGTFHAEIEQMIVI